MDLANMMRNMGLFEKDSVEGHFTWFNKHLTRAIYYMIDKVIRNMQWIQKHMGTTLKIMEPRVSDYAMLCLEGQDKNQPRKSQFKFQNIVIIIEGFHEAVKAN